MKYLKTLFCLILFINIVPTESARAANDLFQQIYPPGEQTPPLPKELLRLPLPRLT